MSTKKSKNKTSVKSNNNTNVKVQNENANKKEIKAIILLASSIFAFVCMIGKAGIVGNFVRAIIGGFFGFIGSILLIIAMVVLAIAILRGTVRKTFSVKRVLVSSFLCIFITALLHTLAIDYVGRSFWNTVASLFNAINETSGNPTLAGGLIGGGLSTLLVKYTTEIGALVILIPGTLIFTMLLFKISLIPFFKKLGEIFAKIGSGLSSFWKRLTAKKENNSNKVKTVSASKVKIHTGEELSDTENSYSEKPDITITDNTKEPQQEPVVFVFDDLPITEWKGETADNPVDFKLPEMKATEEISSEIEEKPDAEKQETEAEPQEEQKTVKSNVRLPILSNGEYAKYEYPSLDLLSLDMNAKRAAVIASRAECDETAKKLQSTLSTFGVEAVVTNAYVGPTVTRYELTPKIGTRMEAFKRLSDEIAFYLAAESIRIEAPIPGKSAVGIEVPNKERSTVYLKEILNSEKFKTSKSKLTCSIGADIQNAPVVCDIAKLPHLLIAGTTGSGKSVCTNGIIMSLLYKASPEEVRLILIDPKMVEFDKYNGIPHLLLPVVTDPKKAASALSWAVLEMDRRYEYFATHHVSNISAYNDYAVEKGLSQMPRIVIIIDELADLMMVAKQNVETAIARIAQKARAAGMHLIIATQSPRVDVVTGLIKANIGSRIGLSVSNGTESRIILDAQGAEKLLGKGDMVYAPITESKQIRVQGAFASDAEIIRVVEFISNTQKGDNYIPEVMESIENAGEEDAEDAKLDKNDIKANEKQDRYEQAVQIAMAEGEISTSYIQRKLGIGYNGAADIMDRMERDGIIERGQGSKKSKVIKRI